MAHPIDLDFSGKTAVITGSSRGIGAAIASALARRGARCAINYVSDDAGRNKADAMRLVDALDGARAFACDIGDPAQVRAMFQEIGGAFGEIDILVNNAGILRDRTIRKMSDEDWDAVLRVNLSGAFHSLQASTPLLRAGGRVVNISSVAAWTGFFGQANYAASKAGLMALTRVAARELARQQVTVNAIAPGFVETEMTQGMPPDVAAEFLKQVPLGRRATVEDIVGPVLFLCSTLAQYMTGQVLHVNGGFFMG